MKIVHVAAECHPIAKVGGLADVVYGLAKAQVQMGHTVKVYLPKYDTLHLHLLKNIEQSGGKKYFHYKNTPIPFTITKGTLDSIPLSLIAIDHTPSPFARDGIYGFEDDPLRFILFCKALLEDLEGPIDCLHLHDWHAAPCALLNTDHKKILTIHNAKYQGECQAALLDTHLKDGPIRLLEEGLKRVDRITTVSPSYAVEIQESDKGYGLQSLFCEKGVTGILNGIDTEVWNPGLDPMIVSQFKRSHLAEVKEAKKANRLSLQKQLGMNPPKGPLVGIISRLVPQKGIELMQWGLLRTLWRGGQAILLGSSPSRKIQKRFNNLRDELINNKDIHFHFEFSEELGRKLYAAADIILVPSLFEPCGLTQIIALRYGAIPLVRKTGGLADTIEDEVNGFTFERAKSKDLDQSLERAFSLYNSCPELWDEMVMKGAKFPFSWKEPAAKYDEIYTKL